jgi:hypothetical protein
MACCQDPAVAAAIIEAIKRALPPPWPSGHGQPIKVYMNIGKNMMGSLALGVAKEAQLPELA